MPPSPAEHLHQRLAELEAILPQIEEFPDAAIREQTREMLQTVLEFHGLAIQRIVERLEQGGEAGRAALASLADDELIASVLLLHDVHPRDFETRIAEALRSVEPQLKSHGGSVTLLGISSGGVVRLRLEGSCHGCPSSQATLKNTIEQAIYSVAPDVTGIEVEGLAPPPPQVAAGAGFVPLSQLSMVAAAEKTST
ncbi:MAG TPA: NifU family protein [Pirellulales bacterium]|jgi:Fe-S cluster biogenesis protein NfuA|nr:NifU family protein [Pirellulales bacterium]